MESNAYYQFLIKNGKTNAKVESFRCLLLSTEISKNDVTIYLFSNYKFFQIKINFHFSQHQQHQSKREIKIIKENL